MPGLRTQQSQEDQLLRQVEKHPLFVTKLDSLHAASDPWVEGNSTLQTACSPLLTLSWTALYPLTHFYYPSWMAMP